MKVQGLGKLRWPWKATVVTPADRPPLVMLNRYPGQVIGVAFRLPSEQVFSRRLHKQLSITWARPDTGQYPFDWKVRPRRDVGHGVTAEALVDVTDALGFIDQTIYANDDNRPDLKWTNAEVLELLGMIRNKLVREVADS